MVEDMRQYSAVFLSRQSDQPWGTRETNKVILVRFEQPNDAAADRHARITLESLGNVPWRRQFWDSTSLVAVAEIQTIDGKLVARRIATS